MLYSPVPGLGLIEARLVQRSPPDSRNYSPVPGLGLIEARGFRCATRPLSAIPQSLDWASLKPARVELDGPQPRPIPQSLDWASLKQELYRLIGPERLLLFPSPWTGPH